MQLHPIGHHVLIHADCVEALRLLPEDSFDAVVSDPPYGLGFMAKAWDCDVPGTDFATELHRVLKPGAHALLFGGTRTFHRLAVALEDAGFEIRDCLSWLYGTGFPKSLDVSKAIDATAGAEREVVGASKYAGRASRADFGLYNDSAWRGGSARDVTAPATSEAVRWSGWGTALKPAWEPIIMCRKPLAGTVAENVVTHGTGGINVDACRIGESGGGTNCRNRDSAGRCLGHGNAGRSTSGETFHGPAQTTDSGRWPANVVLDEEAAAMLDAQAGSASRFFYVAKPSRAERDRGCDHLPAHSGGEATDREDGAPGTVNPRAGAGRTGGARNIHPTVKPVALIRWLLQLVTPPGGQVLDPFAGSGTVFAAADGLDLTVSGIEREESYIPIILARGRSVYPPESTP